MKVVSIAGTPQLAMVYMAELGGGKMVEFVEALQPPHAREQRWILMVSTLFGCPVGCLMCDAGGGYRGRLSAGQMLAQVDYLVERHYPDRRVPAAKFKIQFARMGEPALNPAVLEVLEELPRRYRAPGLMPSLSTVAPHGTGAFFDRLIEVKDQHYPNGRFQFQYSLHTTDETLRRQLVPVKTWGFGQMAEYGGRFWRPGDRKITLNFALAAGMPVDPQVLLAHFDPRRYLVKITPINPTYRARQHRLVSHLDPCQAGGGSPVAQALARAGYEVIVSLGEVEENRIGSNCGQYVLNYLASQGAVEGGYTYEVQRVG